MILGHWSAKEAGPKIGQPGSGARHTTVGKLQQAGFIVKRTPSAENPEHVSVSVKGEWTRDHGDAFNACFKPPEWTEEQEERT